MIQQRSFVALRPLRLRPAKCAAQRNKTYAFKALPAESAGCTFPNGQHLAIPVAAWRNQPACRAELRQQRRRWMAHGRRDENAVKGSRIGPAAPAV